jgi:hypothetical protein
MPGNAGGAKGPDFWCAFEDGDAKKQINELKYPPHLRRLFSALLWAAWGGLILFIFYIVSAQQ